MGWRKTKNNVRPWTGALQAREEAFRNSKSTTPSGEVNATRCWAPRVNRTAWSVHLLRSEDVADRAECLGVSGCGSSFPSLSRHQLQRGDCVPVQFWCRHAGPIIKWAHHIAATCRSQQRGRPLSGNLLRHVPLEVRWRRRPSRAGGVTDASLWISPEQHLGAPTTYIGSNSVLVPFGANRRLFAAGCEEPRVDEFEARSVVSTTSQVRLQLCSGNSHS